MTELELLNVGRSAGQEISSDFAQVITISFAMVVAIYYFLHQAGFRMKCFAFSLYTCGMFAYLGMMLLESGVLMGAIKALEAIPEPSRSIPTIYFLELRSSWVGMIATLLLNLVFWALWIGNSLLLFFWKKPAQTKLLNE